MSDCLNSRMMDECARRIGVGMQVCGDVMIMIGQHGRSMHELYPHILGSKGDSHFSSCFYHHPEINNHQLNQRLNDYLTPSMTILLVVALTY